MRLWVEQTSKSKTYVRRQVPVCKDTHHAQSQKCIHNSRRFTLTSRVQIPAGGKKPENPEKKKTCGRRVKPCTNYKLRLGSSQGP